MRHVFIQRRRWRANDDEKAFFLTILLPLLLSGCGSLTKSDYQRPMLSVPAEWRVQDTGSGYLQHTDHWWDNFEDPQLSMLIGRALTSNNDLAIAGIQLQQADWRLG
ncbi:Outer membrane protein oprM precursor [Serratia fonticola]|uniref:Outer membrane protein oprM n=1 Tax=Serratia fonticola TaxID=47917 RepID=A0A4U9UI15_SERFO|nr:Outer membrane protein oprM precursor [Serratia fonticola]